MNPEGLTERQTRVLHALCRQFILDGAPVSSGALRKAARMSWSAATIRNELAYLEQRGFVSKPHQASGRLPTASGLRAYVGALPADAEPPPAHQRALAATADWNAAGLRATARVLSELAGCAAIAFFGGTRSSRLRDVEIMRVGENRALIVAATEDGATTMHTVDADRALLESEAAVRRVRARLRELTVGRTLMEARGELRERLQEQESRVDQFLGQALRMGMALVDAAAFDPLRIQVVGQPSLTTALGEGGRLSEVLGVLDDYYRLADILCQLLPGEDPACPRASVHLGVPLASSAPADEVGSGALSLVGCRVPLPGAAGGTATTGAVALLGPSRMDYRAVIPLVEYAARAASRG